MISIKDFHKGQASSPYVNDGAYSKSANLDVFSQPGIARINYLPVKKSAASGANEVTELIYSFARNPSDHIASSWYDPTTNGANYNDWTNPANAYASDNVDATFDASTSAGKQDYYTFGFAIPTGATISGIEVSVEAAATGGSKLLWVGLAKGTATLTSVQTATIGATDAYHTFGGSTFLWGWDWTPANINSGGFTVAIWAPGAQAGITYFVDHVRVRVHYIPAGTMLYAAGESGTVWQSTDSGDTWTVLAASKGRYIKVWKGYLFAILDNVINVYDITNDDWDNDDWQTTLDSTSEHFMFVSENDGNLYICNHKYIASVIENSGETFDPETGATFTFKKDHLTLYEPFRAICLAEQRENLLIGAIQGLPSSPKASSSIFVWDRAAEEFDFPLFLSGEFITSMVNVQNRVFIVTDLNGKVYSFSESGLTFVRQISFDYDNNKHIRIGHKGHSGIAYWKDKILLGASSEDELAPAGIYGLYGKSINCEHLISTGEDGSNDDVLIGAVYPFDGDTLLYGYYDAENSKYGIDKVKTSYNRATGYISYLESIFYRVGTELKPANFRQIEVQLSRPLQIGEGIKLEYRESIDAGWTDIDTKAYSTANALSSLLFDLSIYDVTNIQIRCELTTGASSTNTPYLLEIRLT